MKKFITVFILLFGIMVCHANAQTITYDFAPCFIKNDNSLYCYDFQKGEDVKLLDNVASVKTIMLSKQTVHYGELLLTAIRRLFLLELWIM